MDSGTRSNVTHNSETWKSLQDVFPQTGAGRAQPGADPGLCILFYRAAATWPCASTLCLTFSICKMGMMAGPTSRGCDGEQVRTQSSGPAAGESAFLVPGTSWQFNKCSVTERTDARHRWRATLNVRTPADGSLTDFQGNSFFIASTAPKALDSFLAAVSPGSSSIAISKRVCSLQGPGATDTEKSLGCRGNRTRVTTGHGRRGLSLRDYQLFWVQPSESST
ncbi:uncharacterized protein LOC123637291 [Lemur catta]|uniref:uncharacterized protein LOC123637291 n=1 Tax=Lemur catta TaxID=9447 RepID=UPI001E26816A|nr:uncharacterized protein LOC123637291 [Lemur catta]